MRICQPACTRVQYDLVWHHMTKHLGHFLHGHCTWPAKSVPMKLLKKKTSSDKGDKHIRCIPVTSRTFQDCQWRLEPLDKNSERRVVRMSASRTRPTRMMSTILLQVWLTPACDVIFSHCIHTGMYCMHVWFVMSGWLNLTDRARVT